MSIRCTSCLRGHQGDVGTVAELVGSTQTFITSSSEDKTVKVWDANEGRCVKTFSNLDSSLVDVAVVNWHTIILVSGKCVQVRHVPHGRILATSNDFQHKIISCAALSSTTALVCDTRRTLMKIGWRRGRIEIIARKKLNFQISSIEAQEDTFVTCLSNFCAVLWDTTSFSAIRTFCGHKNALSSVAYDDTYFITASHDETIRIYGIHTASHVTTIRTHKGWVRCVRKVVGTNLIVSGGDDKIVALHSIPSGECIAKYNIGMSVESIALLNDGKVAVAGSRPNEVKILRFDHLPIPTPRGSGEQSDALEVAVREAMSWREAYDKLENRLLSALDRIKKLEQSTNLQDENTDDVCCIDLERFCSGDEVFRLPCLHVHHVECLLPYLKRQSKPECPVCRTAVPADDLNNLPIWRWKNVEQST